MSSSVTFGAFSLTISMSVCSISDRPLSIDVVAIGVGGRLMILLIGGYIEPAENIVPLPSHRIASFEGISKKTYVGVLVPAAIWLLNMGHIK